MNFPVEIQAVSDSNCPYEGEAYTAVFLLFVLNTCFETLKA